MTVNQSIVNVGMGSDDHEFYEIESIDNDIDIDTQSSKLKVKCTNIQYLIFILLYNIIN
jgi:hypothetical protein